MNSIELYATKVVPMVKEILSADRAASIAASR